MYHPVPHSVSFNYIASGRCCLLDSGSFYTCSAPQPASASLDRPLDPGHHSKLHRNLPHIRWRLNAGHEFKRNVPKTDEGNDGPGSVLPPLITHADAANEEVDCHDLA